MNNAVSTRSPPSGSDADPASRPRAVSSVQARGRRPLAREMSPILSPVPRTPLTSPPVFATIHRLTSSSRTSSISSPRTSPGTWSWTGTWRTTTGASSPRSSSCRGCRTPARRRPRCFTRAASRRCATRWRASTSTTRPPTTTRSPRRSSPPGPWASRRTAPEDTGLELNFLFPRDVWGGWLEQPRVCI